jgi:hypothetical protein
MIKYKKRCYFVCSIRHSYKEYIYLWILMGRAVLMHFGALGKTRFGDSVYMKWLATNVKESQIETRPNVHYTMFELPVNTKDICHKKSNMFVF